MTFAEIENHRRLGHITDLQAQVLHYRRKGISYQTIADGLGRAKATIREHERAARRNIAEAERRKPAA